MPCINPDGTLTEAALTLMKVITEYHSLDEVASITDIPLYLVRATARDLLNTKLVAEEDGRYYLTDLGSDKLKLTIERAESGDERQGAMGG